MQDLKDDVFFNFFAVLELRFKHVRNHLNKWVPNKLQNKLHLTLIKYRLIHSFN